MTPTFGLFGSGEFLPWAEPVDRWLVESAPGRGEAPRVLVVPTASAPEGEAVFRRWGSMGTEHYERLGFRAEVLGLHRREDAEDAGIAAAVAGASLLYFSGGNPAYLVRALKGTAFWAAVEQAVAAGCALAGSSAGIAFLGARTFDPAAAMPGGPRLQEQAWVDAMAFFPNAVFGPHWDAVDRWMPGASSIMLAAVPDDCAFLGIDEDTAVVGDGQGWEVRGRGSATVRPAGGDAFVVPSGDRFTLALRPARKS